MRFTQSASLAASLLHLASHAHMALPYPEGGEGLCFSGIMCTCELVECQLVLRMSSISREASKQDKFRSRLAFKAVSTGLVRRAWLGLQS